MVDVARRFLRREYRVGDFSLGRRRMRWFLNCFGSDRLDVILDTAAVAIWSLLAFLVGFGRCVSAIQNGCFLRLEEVAERAPATAAAPSSAHLLPLLSSFLSVCGLQVVLR